MSSYFRYFLQQQALVLIFIGSLQAASSKLPLVQRSKDAPSGKFWAGIGGIITTSWSRLQKRSILEDEQAGKELCNKVQNYRSFEQLIMGLNSMSYDPIFLQHNKQRFCTTITQLIPSVVKHECNKIFRDVKRNLLDVYEKTIEAELESSIETYKKIWISQNNNLNYNILGFNFNNYVKEIQKECKRRTKRDISNKLIIRWSDKISKECNVPRKFTESPKDHILNFFKRLNESSENSSIETIRLAYPALSTIKIKICDDDAPPMPRFYDFCGDVQWQKLYHQGNGGNIKQHRRRLQNIDNLILKYRQDHEGDDNDTKAKESLLQSISSVLEQLLKPFEQNIIKGMDNPIPGIPYTTLRIVDFKPCKDCHCKYPIDFDEKTSMGLFVQNSRKHDYVQFKIDIKNVVTLKDNLLKSSNINKLLPQLYDTFHRPPSLKERLPFALNAKNDLLEVPATLAHEAAHALLAHSLMKKMFPDSSEITQALRYQQYEYAADIIALASLQDERYFSACIREFLTLQLLNINQRLTDLLRVPTTGKFYSPKEILAWVETSDNAYGYTQAKTREYLEQRELSTHPSVAMRTNKTLTAWAAYEIHCNGKDFDTATSYVSYKTKDLIGGFAITDTYINRLLIDFIDGWRNEQKILNEQYKYWL